MGRIVKIILLSLFFQFTLFTFTGCGEGGTEVGNPSSTPESGGETGTPLAAPCTDAPDQNPTLPPCTEPKTQNFEEGDGQNF